MNEEISSLLNVDEQMNSDLEQIDKALEAGYTNRPLIIGKGINRFKFQDYLVHEHPELIENNKYTDFFNAIRFLK